MKKVLLSVLLSLILNEGVSAKIYYSDYSEFSDYSLEKILIELLEDISSYFSQDTLFSKVDFSLLGRQMWNDYNNAKNKNLFLKMIIKKNIIDFDLTCSDKDFKQNYYVKVYQKNNKLTDIELLGFRELIFHLSLKLKKEYAEED